MFTFRQKIFISYILVFIVFIILIFPFASRTVKNIVAQAMTDRAAELIAMIKSAPNDEALVRRLKEQKHLIFFRVSVITDERKLLYDSHIKRLLGPKFSQEQVVDHPEIFEAFEKGYGYNEDYSDLLGQKFAYLAKAFDFHGKTYVLRTAFPYKYMTELTDDFELRFVGLSTVVLLLFSAMTLFIMNHLTKPIQQIINAVKPYQDGVLSTLPDIKVPAGNSADEITKLAITLNSLSEKIRKHINSLTQERNEKEAVLESLVEGVVAVNKQMEITYANAMAAKFLEIEKEQLIGHAFNETHQEQCLDLLVMCQRDGIPLTDALTLKLNGGKIYLDIVAAPKKEDTGAILVLQDKTEHYKILEMRKDFIANASHELKTPVTIIRGFAETLHDHPELSPEVQKEITHKIVKNTIRMSKLIKDLLTLADIENIPHSRLIECDLVDLAENCRSLVQDAYPSALIDIVANPDEQFHCVADPQLMEMALMNLTENAAKYSKAPADITLTFQHTNDDKIKITVADKGIGIPEADQEFIFQRFYTVDKTHSQKMGGSGLGLSLVENIIEKHFGRISVQSKVGIGTTFTILLPCHRGHYDG